MKTLSFNNGDQMPALGLGTWKSDPGDVKKAVITALEAGYRHIDCAHSYGNEQEVGEGIHEVLKKGNLKREELWVTSKLWNDAHKKEDVIPALKQSLKDLQLDYLNLYLIHWPVVQKSGVKLAKNPEDFIPLEKVPIMETWNEMEKAVDLGLVKHIGVSNFNKDMLLNLIEHERIKPEMLQVELHPYLPQKELLEFSRLHHVHVTSYSPLGSGDRPKQMKKDNEPILLTNNEVQKVAEKHGVSTGQVLITWALHRGTAVIPKSTSEKHILENLKAADIQLNEEDMRVLSNFSRNYRFVDGSFFELEGNSYTAEQFW